MFYIDFMHRQQLCSRLFKTTEGEAIDFFKFLFFCSTSSNILAKASDITSRFDCFKCMLKRAPAVLLFSCSRIDFIIIKDDFLHVFNGKLIESVFPIIFFFIIGVLSVFNKLIDIKRIVKSVLSFKTIFCTI